MKKYMANGDMDAYGQNMVVITGGQWPRERQRREGYDCEKLCPRCGEALEDLYHRIWACRANCDHNDYCKTDHLQGIAASCREAEPSLWLRGVLPTSLTTPTSDEEMASWAVDVGRDVEEARHCDVLFLSGDGSGGKSTDDPRRRRVGAGYCAMMPDGEGGWSFHGGTVGGLAGRQTVPRAELLAFAFACERTRGKMIFR